MIDIKKLYLPEQKEKQLARKGIFSVEDVLDFRPREYYDFRFPVAIKDLKEKEDAYVGAIGVLVSINNTNPKFLKATFKDSTGTIDVLYFGQKFMAKLLVLNRRYLIAGKVSINPYSKKAQFVNPIYTTLDIEKYSTFVPRYIKIPGMSNEYFQDIIDKSLPFAPILPDYDKKLLYNFKVIEKKTFYKQLHRPRLQIELKEVSKRLVFEKIFDFMWVSKQMYDGKEIKTDVEIDLDNLGELLKKVPFDLTDDQYNTIEAIKNKMMNKEKVLALVQGDVGSGKTIVAFLLSALVSSNGYQSVICAPTEVLASQHYRELTEEYNSFGLRVAYLSGSTKKRERNKILKDLKNGDIDIIIGTHAVFSKDVEYKNLGLKVIDEEHRFGVKQRETLSKAYPSSHSISMSATPIPRSLALVSHSENLEIYSILQMPKGRKPVTTIVTDSTKQAFTGIVEEVKKGHQAYIVCPLIEEGKVQAEDVENTEKLFNSFTKSQGLNIKAKSINGKMKKEEIEEITNEFKAGNIDVLISTTIIEVGINVANTTVMVIMSSERFGLSQLHQLRGRVGRSSLQSYCILVSKKEDTPRLKIMESSTNGFEIAKADLKLRGPGDLIGTKQSGKSEEIALIISFPKLVERIKVAIDEIYEDEERLKTFNRYYEYYFGDANWRKRE